MYAAAITTVAFLSILRRLADTLCRDEWHSGFRILQPRRAGDRLRVLYYDLLSIVPADFDGEEVAKNRAVRVIQTLFRMDEKAPPVEPCPRFDR